jgi:hypothetical protein
VKFGRQLTLTRDGDIVRAEETVYYDSEPRKQTTILTETVKLRNPKDFLTECLELDRRFQQGEIDLPGIQLLRNKHNGDLRVEKTWTPLSLQ